MSPQAPTKSAEISGSLGAWPGFLAFTADLGELAGGDRLLTTLLWPRCGSSQKAGSAVSSLSPSAQSM